MVAVLKLVNKYLTLANNRVILNLLTSSNIVLAMPKPKGGRGQTAPYETTHIRVPVPLKLQVEQMVEKYRQSVLGGTEFESDRSQPTLDEAVEIARSILKQKKSAKQSIEKLLTSLYGEEIKL